MHRPLCFALPLLLSIPGVAALHAQSRPAPTVTSDGILQSKRPIPGDVYESAPFTIAVGKGTRTRTGAPGARNWVQHARYTIDASLDNATHTITGKERVVYLNNSPDTLSYLLIHLRQNVFKPDAQRSDASPISSGMLLNRVDSVSFAKWVVRGTVMRATLRDALLPHDSVAFDVEWSYVPALTPADGREGRDDDLYFMGYW